MALKTSDAQLRWWYSRYNRAYFRGRLGMPYRIRFGNASDGNIAETTFLGIGKTSEVVEILISRRVQWSLRLSLAALLHEMIHVARPRAEHGEGFARERRRLFREGAFDGLI